MSRGFQQLFQLACENAKLGRENGIEFSASEVRTALSALAPRSSELSAFAAYFASLGQGGNG